MLQHFGVIGTNVEDYLLFGVWYPFAEHKTRQSPIIPGMVMIIASTRIPELK